MRRSGRRSSQVPRGGVHDRAEHRQRRDPISSAASARLGASAAQAHAVEDVPLAQPHRGRAAGRSAYRLSVELSRAAAAQPARSGRFGRLHGRIEALAPHAARIRDSSADDKPNIRPAIHHRHRGRPRGQYHVVRTALRHHILHGQPVAGQGRHAGRGTPPHARGVGVGRQEPLHRGPRRRHTYRRAAHRMGQDAQCRTDMYRSRLSAHTPQRETTLRRGVRRSHQADARRRPAAESALCTHGRRCGIPARRVVPRPRACGGRRPKLHRRPVYRADATRRRSRRCRRHAGGDIRPSAADDRLRRYSPGRPIHRRQGAAAGSILFRPAGRRTRSRPPDIVGRRLHQRHDNAHRQPQTALRRRRQLGHGRLSRPHGLRGLFAPPCRRHDTHGIRSAVPLYALPHVPLG